MYKINECESKNVVAFEAKYPRKHCISACLAAFNPLKLSLREDEDALSYGVKNVHKHVVFDVSQQTKKPAKSGSTEIFACLIDTEKNSKIEAIVTENSINFTLDGQDFSVLIEKSSANKIQLYVSDNSYFGYFQNLASVKTAQLKYASKNENVFKISPVNAQATGTWESYPPNHWRKAALHFKLLQGSTDLSFHSTYELRTHKNVAIKENKIVNEHKRCRIEKLTDYFLFEKVK